MSNVQLRKFHSIASLVSLIHWTDSRWSLIACSNFTIHLCTRISDTYLIRSIIIDTTNKMRSSYLVIFRRKSVYLKIPLSTTVSNIFSFSSSLHWIISLRVYYYFIVFLFFNHLHFFLSRLFFFFFFSLVLSSLGPWMSFFARLACTVL